MINIGMRLYELFDNLLEAYDPQLTLAKQGPKLKAAYDKNEFDSALAGGEVESSEILTRLEQMDPTTSKQWMPWIIREYINGKMRLEDYPQVFSALTSFVKAKPKLPANQKDIYQFDLPQLYQLISSFSDTQQDPANDTKLNRDDVEVIYNGPLGTIAIPKTEEASCELGSGTQWCTAGETNNVFRNYANAPLYIFQAPGGAKYQFEGKPKAKQFIKFSDGFAGYNDDLAYAEGTYPYGIWAWPPSRYPKESWVADARDRYLEDSEIEELYAKNPVLQKYLPLPDKAPDVKVHQEEFKQFIKKYWLERVIHEESDEESDKYGDGSDYIWIYEKYFGPYELERDINFEKAALYGTGSGRLKNHLNYLSTSDSSHSSSMLYHIGEELLGLGWYMKATGMETWPELEKEIIKALKIWHSKNHVELAGAYKFGFEWDTEGKYEEISKMPSVIKYLKSIGLSDDAYYDRKELTRIGPKDSHQHAPA